MFVDLVGFTERSDHADPEDVRRTLVPFHRQVKDDLERFGGTLDKFIGDAVMGVFGAPVAHEDDPLRAVRASLRIIDSIEDLRRDDPAIAVRIAVHTGEAVVSSGAGPQVGEWVAGDVVNTASRMQSLAPRDAVVVGRATLDALGPRFDVEELPPAVVKGKSEPLQVWRVFGERTESEPERTPFVGRDVELETLSKAFDDAVSGRTCRVVTVVGEAGVGKSRLASELERRVAAKAAFLAGSSSPSGERFAFAPIRDTVRALAGLASHDDAELFLDGLDALVARTGAGADRQRWLASTLAATLGLPTAPRDAEIMAGEIADAWASVLVLAAAGRPLLLVLHDLHLADPLFLEVLHGTIDLLRPYPVLVLITARAELAELSPVWVGTPANRTVLHLGALDERATLALLAAVLLDETVSPRTHETVLERSGGNPLYAIEFARMLTDAGGAGSDRVSTPLSVQAVIAARLDTIPAEPRAVLLDASVLGEEVWPEALANIGERDPEEVRTAVELLERRGLLVRRASSFPTLDAYGFTHALIREVAYARLPRAARARAHLRSGRWLEAAVGERGDDWAEALARHHASAVELGEAAKEIDVAERAREPALRWLIVAGDRAARVDPAAAFAVFERALGLAPLGSARREDVLWRAALSGRRSGMLDASEVLARQEEGLALARARGAHEDIGSWLTRMGSQLAALGETERARAALLEAVEVLERLPPGRPLARAYAFRAEEDLFAGDTEGAIALADRSLALMADEPDELAVMALHIRGDARCSMGDLDRGFEDLDAALRLSETAGIVGDIITSRNYLGEWKSAVQGPAAGLEELEAALELAERRNVLSQAAYARASAIKLMFDAGEWDRALEWSDHIFSLVPERTDRVVFVVAEVVRSRVSLARGDLGRVADDGELVRAAERVGELHALAPALVAAAEIALARGDRALAAERVERFEAATEGVAAEYRAFDLARAVRVAIAAGRVDLGERLVATAEPRVLRDRLRSDVARAMLAEAHGEGAAEAYADVAARLHDYGDAFEEAIALLGHARVSGDETSRGRAVRILDRLGVTAVTG